MSLEILKLIEAYKNKNNPKSFVDLAKELKEKGFTKDEVYTAFLDVFVVEICVDGQLIVEDRIEAEYMDALDRIWGYCSSQNKIFE